jgi:lincosamide nucleotidyltransferase
MAQSSASEAFRQCLVERVQSDERILGLLQTGSGSEGRTDQWSDLDVVLFLQDADMPAFLQAWKEWIEPCAHHLLAYQPEGQASIAWTLFQADPIPFRVDFRFIPASQMESVRTWPTSPRSPEEIILVDKTHGQLSDLAHSLLGRSQRLPATQEESTFEQHCNKMWYFLHSAFCKLERGDHWYARLSFHIAVLDELIALLKLESGAVQRWLASFPSWKLEQALSPRRLSQLNACIPSAGAEALKEAMRTTASLGREVCETLATQHGWTWPREAAEEVIEMLTAK